jgi:hypothetical protein
MGADANRKAAHERQGEAAIFGRPQKLGDHQADAEIAQRVEEKGAEDPHGTALDRKVLKRPLQRRRKAGAYGIAAEPRPNPRSREAASGVQSNFTPMQHLPLGPGSRKAGKFTQPA